MSESPKSPKRSKTEEPNPARPFSFRPQDFGAPERLAATSSGNEAEKSEQEEQEPLPGLSLSQETAGGVSRVNTHARAERDSESHKVARKEEHTILMAVPPPAQVNKGS